MTHTATAAPRRRISGEEAMTLWRRYKAAGDPRLRDRLVMTYAPLVKYIVFKKVRELPARCEVDDFISCGLEALIAAIDRYDPGKGATLEQFVWTRIHGAVLDELRRLDWAPRSLRRWERDIESSRRRFVVAAGREPTREELAAALGVTVEELRGKQDDIALCDVTSLNALVSSDEDSTIERVDTIVEPDARSEPEHAFSVLEAKRRFRTAFDELPRREREVAVLLYVKNLTLREIGGVLGVSESRVCQIHAQLKRTLRQQLRADEALFEAVA